MGIKQWEALVSLVSAIVVGGWVALDAAGNAEIYATAPALAGKLLWAVGYMVVLNIVGMLVVLIVVAAVTRGEVQDERADERDKAITTKAMRNAYVVLSIGAGAVLILLASSAAVTTVAFVLFGAMMTAGAAEAASRLVYYRIG